jgi:hypothetical protein
VDASDYAKAIEITLRYYDKAYRYGLRKKNQKNLIYIDTDTDNIGTNAMKILEAADSLKW